MLSYWSLLLLLHCDSKDYNFSCSFSLSIQSLHIQMLLTYWPLFTWPCSSTSGSTESVTGEPHLVHSGTNFTKYSHLYVYTVDLCIYTLYAINNVIKQKNSMRHCIEAYRNLFRWIHGIVKSILSFMICTVFE